MAACTPVVFFFLLFISIIIFTVIILRSRRRKAELRFKETILNRRIEVLEIIKEKLPEDLYPQLLNFAKDIVTTGYDACSSSPNNRSADHVSALVLSTVTTTLQSGLSHPKVGPHLQRTVSTIMTNRMMSSRSLDVPAAVSDPGYESHNSNSIMEEAEMTKEHQTQV